MEKSPEYIKARASAIKYILFKPRTATEVYNKLINLEYNEKIVTKVVEDLIQLDYINDEEYTKRFIENNQRNKKNSKNAIKLKLRNKGIIDEIIEKYCIECGFDDVQIVKRIIEKKNFSCKMEFSEQNKIKNYCLRKGFNISDILKAIKLLEEE